MADKDAHGLPPWVVALGLALPWSPPGGEGALIADDMLLLLLTAAIAVTAWRAAPKLALRDLRVALGLGFGTSLVAKQGLPAEALPGVAMVSGALLFGVAYPFAAGLLFADEDESCPAD